MFVTAEALSVGVEGEAPAVAMAVAVPAAPLAPSLNPNTLPEASVIGLT